jgi:hypothetical protein
MENDFGIIVDTRDIRTSDGEEGISGHDIDITDGWDD